MEHLDCCICNLQIAAQVLGDPIEVDVMYMYMYVYVRYMWICGWGEQEGEPGSMTKVHVHLCTDYMDLWLLPWRGRKLTGPSLH